MKQLSLRDLSESKTWYEKLLNKLNIKEHSGWPDTFGEKLKDLMERNNSKKIKVLSLFTGAGGLDIGFHDTLFETVEMVEFNNDYVKTLENNVGKNNYFNKPIINCIDIRNYNFNMDNNNIDFIIGGPPCQSFSAAGRRAAGADGSKNERGLLFYEYVRILKEVKPKGFLFENVKGITSTNNGDDWSLIKEEFKKAGYSIYSKTLDAADYGVPQNRERVFIVGIQEELNIDYRFPYPTHGPDSLEKRDFYNARLAVKDIEVNKKLEIGGKNGHLINDIPPGLNYSFYTKKRGHPNPVFSWRSKFSDYLYKADPDRPVKTLKAKVGHYSGPFSWENRRFSIDEFKRLQTIPDKYNLIGGRPLCIEQIGNSVPPQVARILALSILDQIFNIRLPFNMEYISLDFEFSYPSRKYQLRFYYEKKAKEGLNNINEQCNTSFEPIHKIVTRTLDESFSWEKNYNEVKNKEFSIEFDLNSEEWNIKSNHNENNNVFYRILIKPKENWQIPVNKVNLIAGDDQCITYTSLWKAFEEKVKEFTNLEDLVQLNGYYNYEPKIIKKIQYESIEINDFWCVIEKINENIGVSEIYSICELSKLWNIDKNKVKEILLKLNDIGYEIRNNKTNNQIPESYYLIPYSFPNLNKYNNTKSKKLR